MDCLLSVDFERTKTIKLRCELYTPNMKHKYAISLVYDTGSDKTSITKDTLMLLGYSAFKKTNRLQRNAVNMKYATICNVSKMVVGKEFQRTNIFVDVMDVESSPNFNGVIGMDFISLVESVISGSRGTLEITMAKKEEAT